MTGSIARLVRGSDLVDPCDREVVTQGDFTTDARLALHRDGWSESIVKLRSLVESER